MKEKQGITMYKNVVSIFTFLILIIISGNASSQDIQPDVTSYLLTIDSNVESYHKVYKEVEGRGNGRALVFENWGNLLTDVRNLAYFKGTYVIHLLKETLGDGAFWNALRYYSTKYIGKTVETVDFQKAFQESSGIVLNASFREWGYHTHEKGDLHVAFSHNRAIPDSNFIKNNEVWESKIVTASAYNSLVSQTNSHPNITAFGDSLKPGMKCIAVSSDLLEAGLKHNTRVKIEGLQGEYIVNDKMHSRWTNHIDVYMGVDVNAAKQWGKKKVRIEYCVPQEN